MSLSQWCSTSGIRVVGAYLKCVSSDYADSDMFDDSDSESEHAEKTLVIKNGSFKKKSHGWGGGTEEEKSHHMAELWREHLGDKVVVAHPVSTNAAASEREMKVCGSTRLADGHVGPLCIVRLCVLACSDYRHFRVRPILHEQHLGGCTFFQRAYPTHSPLGTPLGGG